MSQPLAEKVAVITGGTSGIGEATAARFVEAGAQVVICGRSEDKGEALAKRLGERCRFIRADVTQEADIERTLAFDGMLHAIPLLRARGGGVIINNSSIAAIRDNQGDLIYSAIKAALTHYTRLASVRLGPENIRVNCISPGAIATPIFWGGSARANTLTPEENDQKMAKLQANLAKATPLKRSGIADDIAQGALYLASDAGGFVNGHDLVIDGGRINLFNES